MVKKFLLWIAVILTSVMIFSFSADSAETSKSISGSIMDKIVEISKYIIGEKEISDTDAVYTNTHKLIRKIGHFTEFALLGVFSFLLAKSYNFSLKMAMLIALAYCISYAISDEIHQLFVEGRSCMPTDVLIDSCGSFFGAGLFCLKYRFQHKKQ